MTYYALRNYGVGTDNGEIGRESSPNHYIANLITVFRDVRRVLRNDGVCFVNISDSYAGCVDEKTDALTKNGWKNLDEINIGDEILTLNASTYQAEWGHVDAVNIFPARKRRMLEVSGRGHSSLTTENHRWYTEHRNGDHGKGRKKVRTVRLSSGLKVDDRIPICSSVSNAPQSSNYSDALVEVIAWYWTEGHDIEYENGKKRFGGVYIVQSNQVHPQYVDRIRRALSTLWGEQSNDLLSIRNKKPAWIERVWDYRDDKTEFRLNVRAAEVIRQYAPNRIPLISWLSSLTSKQLHLFVDVSMMADGCIQRDGDASLAQISRDRAEMFQAACIIAGNNASVTNASGGRHSVQVRKNKWIKLLRHPHQWVDHEGRVWCPTTNNGSWLARRDGQVYFTGNSGGPGSQYDSKATTGFKGEFEKYDNPNKKVAGLKPLDMIGIPQMFSLAMRDEGWYLRSEIIWLKRSPMCESVDGWRWEQHRIKIKSLADRTHETGHRDYSSHLSIKPATEYIDCPGCDKCIPNEGLVLRKGSWRPTSATEKIFMFSKTSEYFCDAESVREKLTESSTKRYQTGWNGNEERDYAGGVQNHLSKYMGSEAAKGATGRNMWNYVVVDNDPTPEFLRWLSNQPEWESLSQRFQEESSNPDNGWFLQPANYSGLHYACVDEETECLTMQGWKRYDQLAIGETIASFDLTTRSLRWKELEDIHCYSVANQEMVHAQSASLDMFLTPDHRCIIERYASRKKGFQKPRVRVAKDLLFSDLVPTVARWEEGGCDFNGDWAELLGWYIAEGNECRKSLRVDISQSLSTNAPKVDIIRNLLNKLEIEYDEATCHRDWRGKDTLQTVFSLNGYGAARLRELAPHKRLSVSVLEWSALSIQRLFNGLIGGDGHIRRSDNRIGFSQKDKGTADLVQLLAIRLGMSAAVRPIQRGSMWAVYMTKHTRRSLRGTSDTGAEITHPLYTGTVWCPQTEDGTWVARRNGWVFITGNSFPPDLPRRCILAGTSSRGVCPKCGAPCVRIVKRTNTNDSDENGIADMIAKGVPRQKANLYVTHERGSSDTLGWKPSCDCDAGEPIPALVFDPFAGANTTGLVASRLGRRFVGTELSEKYCKLGSERVFDDAPLLESTLAEPAQLSLLEETR